MQHIRSLSKVHLTRPSVVTIGAFDGVHRGHQYLLSKLIDHARATGYVPAVLTFYPHPRMVLQGPEPGFYLMLPDDKARLLGEMGVELVITHPFNDEVRQIRAADFVDRLIRHLNMQALWVGADFALGYRREGTVAFLQQQGVERGFAVEVVDLMDAGDERVSSSRVRAALSQGDVAEAARLLGRPYFVSGTVVEGARRGRMIGIPTANLTIPEEVAIPARGVYAARVPVHGHNTAAVVNIGMRPTFEGESTMTVEAHLLDFSGDLYGRELSVHFVQRLRDEQKFNGVEALLAQIERDIASARELLGG
jgi:riboflavin kinase/FMN adenylyltransferase